MPRTLYPWDQKTNAPSFYELTSPPQYISLELRVKKTLLSVTLKMYFLTLRVSL